LDHKSSHAFFFCIRHRPACPGDPITDRQKWIARMKRAMTIDFGNRDYSHPNDGNML
jgi:hypothetical protein